MAPRRFDTRTARHAQGLRSAPARETPSRSLLLAAIGAAIGAVVVLAVSGRFSRGGRRDMHDRQGRRRLADDPEARRRETPAAEPTSNRHAALDVAHAVLSTDSGVTESAGLAPVYVTAQVLEDRVLAVFTNDRLLGRRPIDIGADGRGRVELAGSVQSRSEARYAVTLARGVPAVADVIDGLVVRPLV